MGMTEGHALKNTAIVVGILLVIFVGAIVGKKLNDEAWKQLKDEVKPEKKAETLKDQIADRIVKGQNQIASQPFDF